MADSRFPKMTAKTVMTQILEDQVISNGDLFEATLKTAREPKMGVTPLMKLHAQLFGEEISLGKPQWKRSLVDLSTKR